MFVFNWEAHLGEDSPLLWPFTHERDENRNVAIIRQTNGTFEFYEGEDGQLFPADPFIRIKEDQMGTAHSLELRLGYQLLEEPVTLEQFGDDSFMDLWGRFWVITDPARYDFEQNDQSVIMMTPRS